DLPEFVTRPVAGTMVRLYPALIARANAVDLTLLDSEQAAQSATREGLRLLLTMASRQPLSVLAKRVPPPFPEMLGLPPSRAAREAFRERVLARVVDEAFDLETASNHPRTKVAFDARIAEGTPRLHAAFERLTRAISAASTELEQTLRALAQAANQPSGTRAARDIQEQLTHLFPVDLVSQIELIYLEQYPRYLRAAQIRLSRAIIDPRKDAEKVSPFARLWTRFLQKYLQRRDRSG